MKKCPFELDSYKTEVYCLEHDGEVFGPYRTESAAKKAAGRAGIAVTIKRVLLTASADDDTSYTPPALG